MACFATIGRCRIPWPKRCSRAAAKTGDYAWEPMPGLAKTTTGIVPDPTTPSKLYASDSEAGVLVSLDSGRTWTVSNTGLDGRGILRLAAAREQGVAYAVAESGVFRSLDGGATWSSEIRSTRRSSSSLIRDPPTRFTRVR